MRATALASSLLCAFPLVAQSAAAPQTIAESSAYQRTSRAADVAQFVAACRALPHGDRLTVRVAGKSHEGRDLMLVKASLPADEEQPRLRALVIGSIHSGECEGKEAAQELLRAFAGGEHEDVLRRCDVWFLPIYNVDGNEAVAVGNRRGQNGPDEVGTRANAQGLDLNRDFVKADAPETRVLLSLFDEIDPHLFVDLHTTNGSHHGYHLTYAPSLDPNTDARVDAISRELLAATRAEMKRRGFETFDYGNFATRDWDGGGAPSSARGVRGWYTYDHRPRYGINYYGLRNRIGVLSEAYSYCDFETRIAATRAFVLTLLEQLIARERAALAAMRMADEAATTAGGAPLWFGTDTRFAPPEHLPVLTATVERVERTEGLPRRFARTSTGEAEELPVVRRFQSRNQQRLPNAWAIRQPTPEVLQRLTWHGIAFDLVDTPRKADARRFAIAKKRKPKRPYQGHQALVLEGRWTDRQQVELTPGTIVIPADQRLARLAATLLEPLSEDGLSTWNFFEQQTDAFYPVLRLCR